MAEGGHFSLMFAGDLADLSGRHRAIWTGSAWWNDLLVWPVGYGDLNAGVGGNTGFDDIPLAPTHHRATNDWSDSARLYDRAYHHLFCIAALGLWIHRQGDGEQTVSDRGDRLHDWLDRVGRNLPGCGDSAYGRGRLEPPSQHRLRDYGFGPPSLPAVAGNIFGAVPDERNVVWLMV